MFKKSELYRHMSCIDVDIYLCEADVSEECARLLVRYWNRHYKWFHDESDNIVIKSEDFWKWKHVQET